MKRGRGRPKGSKGKCQKRRLRDNGHPRAYAGGNENRHKPLGKFKTTFRKGNDVARRANLNRVGTQRRPPKGYNKMVARRIANLVAEGQSLKQIAANKENHEWGCPKTYPTLYKWYHRVGEFREWVDVASQHRADMCAEEIYEIMEAVESGTMDLAKAKFLSDQHKWLAERIGTKYREKAGSTNISLNAGDGKIDFKILLAGDNKPRQEALPAPYEEGELVEEESEDTETYWSDADEYGDEAEEQTSEEE